jgi:hypothetical protein
MKLIVVGGHTRDIGKTSVAAMLIREFQHLKWTAVKITQYGHGVCSRDGKPCECAPTRHSFLLMNETDPYGCADTCRLLAAGARRSLWLRVRQGQLGDALSTLERSLQGDEYVLIESNSILGFLTPLAYLVVTDSTKQDFKESTRRFLRAADALIPVGSPVQFNSAWPGVEPEVLANKPLFPLSPSDYFNQDLCRFVQSKLAG